MSWGEGRPPGFLLEGGTEPGRESAPPLTAERGVGGLAAPSALAGGRLEPGRRLGALLRRLAALLFDALLLAGPSPEHWAEAGRVRGVDELAEDVRSRVHVLAGGGGETDNIDPVVLGWSQPDHVVCF